jgi:polyisoprenoid-binding protein YceI
LLPFCKLAYAQLAEALDDTNSWSHYRSPLSLINLLYQDVGTTSVQQFMEAMMNKKTLTVIGIAALLVIVAGLGFWAYDAILGEAQAASGAVTAVPLATSVASETSTTSDADLAVFEISQADSEVSFSIYEELAGQPKTVVGVTDQVAGQIAINLDDLSQSQVGVIQVNARTFVTDNNRRNNALRNFILTTDQYEFITFTPTDVINLSGNAEPGQALTFQIAGDLTIRNVTQPVVFEVTVQGDTTRLTGTATAVIDRNDYNLTIPSVPSVANVGREITLEINFVAKAAG